MQKKRFYAIMAIYLLGLVVGGLYVGMVAPVRTVIQADFGIGNEMGIWIITIYALFYAAFIPIIAKAADRMGRKPIFLGCMAVFCAGAVVCSLRGSYLVLLLGRVLQAVGACGIIPLANAEIGASAPPEKRGFALGITAAASGLSNVLGAGIGSAIIGAVGQENWPVLFYACLPFGLLAIAAGSFLLPKGAPKQSAGEVDLPGSVTVVVFVFAALLGIQGVYPVPAFVCAGVSLVLFLLFERRAADPVIAPHFLRSRSLLLIFGISLLVGAMINSMALIPEFAEAALGLETGSGGVYMVVIGVFSMFGPPLGGKLIDRFGPKYVLMAGLAVATAGYLILALVAARFPSPAAIIVGLAVMGLGLGFSMGAPVNYMIFENADLAEINSALGAATLVRQLGVSAAPVIYVAFIRTGVGSAGYLPMFLVAAVSSGLAVLLSAGYRSRKEEKG
ncbi:MAG: MFS transporter [Ruminiclostridium sp.]|nr:MFS transporter [Ruminiclostridium sp.]